MSSRHGGALRLPDWPEIYREAVARDDEHDLSLTFSAGEEFKHYGDCALSIRGGEAPEPRLMILANARLPEGGFADVEIAGGLIAALHAPGSADPAGERIDLAGALVLPALVDGHIHLDKTHWGAPRLPHVEGRGVRERIAAERVERHRVALPIEARAAALIRTLIANGTTRARSHVDIDNDVGLANLEALLRVREAFRDWIDIQLVAFPQSGVTTEKGAPDLMAAALSAGADLVGGLDPAGFDGDGKGQLDIVFGLAERFGKGIDIHLHDSGKTGAAELRDIAERTIAAGMQGRVAVSHAFALGSIVPDLFAETADALARAEVAIMTSCPPSAPVPPVGRLERARRDIVRRLRQHSRLLVALRQRRHARPRRDHRRAPCDVH